MKCALITGASGGLGGAACDLFLARGYRIFGLNRSLPKEEKRGLTVIPTDITDRRAVEVYSEGLRRELCYLGIPVIVIRPGAFKTKMESSTAEIFAGICQKTTHYRGVLKKLSGMLEGGTKNAKDPKVLAKVVLRAAEAKRPKRVYQCNHDMGVKLLSKLPAGMVDGIFYMLFHDKKVKNR